MTLNKIAIFILLFFGVFDTARLFTPLPSAFGYLKEICIFFLIIQLVLKRISFDTKSLFGESFLLLFFVCLLNLYRAIFFSDHFEISLLIYQIKDFEFFLIFLIFINLDKLAPSLNLQRIMKWYIAFAAILVLVNLVGVMVPNPVCYKFVGRGADSTMFIGRLSLGQPAMASFPILLSFIIFWFEKMKSVRNSIIGLYFFSYVILSTAMTAYAIIGAVIVFKIWAERKKITGIRRNLVFLIGVISIGVLGYYLLIDFFIQNDSILNFDFLKNRFLKMLGYGDYEDVARYMRTAFRNLIINEVNSRNAFLLGLGPDYFYQIHDKFYADIPIENTYADFYAKSGLLGLGSYMLFIFSIAKKMLGRKRWCLQDDRALCVLGTVITMLLYGWTLPILGTFCMAFGFSLFFAFFYTGGKI